MPASCSRARAGASLHSLPCCPPKCILFDRLWLPQIKGDAQRGTLKFVPLHLQRVDAASDSVQFAPAAFTQMLGLGNVTDAGKVVVMA